MPYTLRVREVARRFDVTEETIRDWINSGKLSAIKLGRSWRVSSEDVERISQEGLPQEPRPDQPRERGT
jgi:excisionase family DNA binding protein